MFQTNILDHHQLNILFSNVGVFAEQPPALPGLLNIRRYKILRAVKKYKGSFMSRTVLFIVDIKRYKLPTFDIRTRGEDKKNKKKQEKTNYIAKKKSKTLHAFRVFIPYSISRCS